MPLPHSDATPLDADFFGESAAMRAVFEQIRLVGPTRATVFLVGETGTGKELAARALHGTSDRADKPFVAVNCAALPAEMIEAELFGHDKGAFTGATRERIGRFERAHRGTLFLDEITEMPVALQAKLLRVLQDRRLEPLGSHRSIELDLRVIAACNRDPRDAVRQGRLREDLYYRLQVFLLALPPLRDRRDDLPGLLRHLAGRHGRHVAWSPAALHRLQAHDWPGNVRELENVVQRALVLCRGPVIDVTHLPPDLSPSLPADRTDPVPDDASSLELSAAVEALERRYIAEALRRTGDNKRRAAALLGLSERTLWYKLERAGVA